MLEQKQIPYKGSSSINPSATEIKSHIHMKSFGSVNVESIDICFILLCP